MELKDAVSLLSTEVFSDAFDGLTTFNGKVNPFSEITTSGETSRRRILETPVTEDIPASRVIESYHGEKFIVADANPDFWNGEYIRYKYPLLPVTQMGAVGTIGSTMSASQPDQQVYCYPYFVRREPLNEERSDYLSGYELYFPNVKKFNRGDILNLGSDYYRCKTDTWVGGAGYSIAQGVKLESPIQVFDIELQSGVYDPITDTFSPTTVPTVECFVEPLNQDYEFVSPSFVAIEAGDKAISVIKTAADPSVNDRIGDYRIQSIRDFGTWVTCQCRRM